MVDRVIRCSLRLLHSRVRPAARRWRPAATPAIDTPAAQPEGVHYFTFDELKMEMQKLAWTKGDYTIVPYGIFWANAVEETGRTTPGNYTLYVSRPRENDNADCYVDARSTRLGIDVLGPQIPFFDCAQSGGKVEVDFQRMIDVENKPSLLLRHAYLEVKNQDFRLLAGQTWDVISPLCPGVLFYSVGWDAGNIGYRRPQFRGERDMQVSDTCEFIAQGSLNTIAPCDTTGTATTYSALPSAWPILEGRLAMLVGPRGPGCLPWELGVSSHVGDMIYDFHRNTAAPGATRRAPSISRKSAPIVALGRSTATCASRSPTPSACRGNCSLARTLAPSSAAWARALTSSPIRRGEFFTRPVVTTSARGAVGSTSGTTGPRACTRTPVTRSTIPSIRT